MDCEEQSRPWCDLPTELLTLILDRLTFANHVRFSATCKKFRDVASKTLHSQSLHLPFLLIPPKSEEELLKENVTWGLYCPLERQIYGLKFPLFTISYKGWLLMPTIPDIHLFNPFTRQLIQLPTTNYPEGVAPLKILLSSSGDSVMVSVITSLGCIFCRVGDPRWTCLHDGSLPEDILFFDGLLYSFDGLMVYVYKFDPKLLLRYKVDVPYIDCTQESYLVESAGEILLVIKHRLDSSLTFVAYKLDPNAQRWEEVRCLGDRMLVLDHNCLRSVLVGNLSNVGFRKNCIYFGDRNTAANYRLFEFCFDDKKIKSAKLDCLDGTRISPQWFMLNA